MKNIYQLEEAGSGLIGHWFWFMLGSLADLNQNSHSYHITLQDKQLTQYQIESFEILKDIVTYYPDFSNALPLASVYPKNSIVTKWNNLFFIKKIIYETFIDKKYIKFLNKIFSIGLSKNFNNTIRKFPKKIYIKRQNSQFSKGNANDGDKKNIIRRQIINENELCEYLTKKNFFCIQAEELHVGEKLLLFENAKCILAPNGGGLVYSFMCKKNTSLIEIVAKDPHQWVNQYHDISHILGLKWRRYQDVKKLDYYDNINVDISKIDKYLKKNSII